MDRPNDRPIAEWWWDEPIATWVQVIADRNAQQGTKVPLQAVSDGRTWLGTVGRLSSAPYDMAGVPYKVESARS